VVGGDNCAAPIAKTDLIQSTKSWQPGPTLLTPRHNASAVALENGCVVIVGGRHVSGIPCGDCEMLLPTGAAKPSSSATFTTYSDEEQQLANTINELNDAYTQIGMLDTQIAGLKTQITDLNDQIAKLTADKASLQNQLATASANNSAQQGLIAQLNNTIAVRDQQIVALNSALADKNSQIAALNQQNSNLQFQVTSLTTQLNAAHAAAQTAAAKVAPAPAPAPAPSSSTVVQTTINPPVIRLHNTVITRGTQIAIDISNFGNSNSVDFGNESVPATLQSGNPAYLLVTVPTNLAPGPISVAVTSDGRTSTAFSVLVQ
jgi:predicted  nucleic acid-binding Zn-ribbon protein